MRLKYLLLSILLFIFGLAFPQLLAAQRYSIIDLSTTDNLKSQAIAINQNGEVTGIVWNIPKPQPTPQQPLKASVFGGPTPFQGDGNPEFFIYSRGKTSLYSASEFGNAALSINDDSEVLGIAFGNGSSHIDHSANFIFSHGKFSYPRDLLPRDNTLVFPEVAGYNDQEQALFTGLYGKAAILDHGKLTYLDTVTKQMLTHDDYQNGTGPSEHPGLLFNNKGHICGISYSGHIFLYADGTCTDIGAPDGLHNFQVAAFNDKDEIIGVGYGRDSDMEGPKLFSYSHTQMLILQLIQNDHPWMTRIRPTSVNNCGVIVGILTTPNFKNNSLWDYSTHAFIITSGKMTDLNDFIDPKAGWVLESANGINDKGQIVGAGQHNGKSCAFLLTPKK